jgi:adenylate kinase family enzyme
MNSRIILIEGIPGTGKTTLINLLIKRYVTENEKIKTLFHLSQLHTYRPIVSDEDNFYASKTETLNHLKKKLQLFNWSVSVGNNKNCNRVFIIIDTLHITHCFRPGSISWTDVVEYDKLLAAIDCKLIFMKAFPETIWHGAILKRNEADNLYLTKYQKKYGNNLEEIHQYYMTEQDKMERLIKESSLNAITLNSENKMQINQDIAYDFWIK